MMHQEHKLLAVNSLLKNPSNPSLLTLDVQNVTIPGKAVSGLIYREDF